ncbi:MAG: hypothetical protein WBA09_22375 [Candidatus Acidiferrum sp.]
MKNLFLAALLLMPSLLMAQAYSGVATSLTGRPIPYATVTVCAGQSDVLIQTPQQACNGQVPINPPAAPTLTSETGAAPAAGTYKIVITYVNGVGETIGSVATSITTSGGSLGIQVTSPAAYSNATSWNAYFTVAGGTIFYLQNASPIAIGTNYTQTAAINTAVVNPPVSTTATNAILPLATIYSNVEQTSVMSNPFSADGNGRYSIFIPSANYSAAISSPGYTTYTFPFSVSGFGTVSVTGSPASGNIAQFSGPASITNSNFVFGQIAYSTPSGAYLGTISPTTMATAGASGNTYRLAGYMNQASIGTSCTGNTTIALLVTYTDPLASATTTVTLFTATITTNGSLGANSITGNSGSYTFRAKTATIVQYSTTVSVGSGCGPGPGYSVYPILEQLN